MLHFNVWPLYILNLIFRNELSGIPSQSVLYSKIGVVNDALAGVSDVVDKVTRLDEEVKSFETGDHFRWWNILH